MELTGLTQEEVSKKKKLGLSNQKIDAFSPTYRKILFDNIFSFTNIILVPLIFVLLYFDLIREVFIFTTYVTMNTIINSFEETRIKRRLDGLQNEFQQRVTVIREGKAISIGADKVVTGDLVKAKEGDTIIADGKVIKSEYLQIDESALTGESDYIIKKDSDTVSAGTYVVTGTCYYEASSLGENNLLNKIGSKSSKIFKKKSRLEKYGTYFISFFVILAIILCILTYIINNTSGITGPETILDLTTIIAVVIPQTLLFIYSLNFLISVTKLSKEDILVQKKGSIDELASIDTLCMDKTGTITANEVKVKTIREFNLDQNEFGRHIAIIGDKIHGRNKTFDSLEQHFKHLENESKISNFKQIPFTSKNKFSAVSFIEDGETKSYIIGAFTKLKDYVDLEIIDKVSKQVTKFEKNGSRVLVSLQYNKETFNEEHFELSDNLERSGRLLIFEIVETLNPGIEEVIKQMVDLDINLKIISGDSLNSVQRITSKIGLPSERAVDLSTIKNKNFNDLVDTYNIFTRVTPEDKEGIVHALKNNGNKVAMIGDGINDVLGMKRADVGIAMETGSKITRDIADIVLLNNDYRKIPKIFFEGDNIVFNLKLATKIFLARAIMMAMIVFFYLTERQSLTIMPSTTLLFSFIGNSFPSYLVIFSRQNISDQSSFIRDILLSAIPIGLIFGVSTILFDFIFDDELTDLKLNTAIVLGILGINMAYSFYLLFEAGKLRSFALIVFGLFFGMLFGTFQTILPLRYIEEQRDQIIGVGLIFFAAVVIHIALRINNKKKPNAVVNYLIPIVVMIFALFFPSRDYYAASPVPVETFLPIFIATVIVGGIIVVYHKLIVERFR